MNGETKLLAYSGKDHSDERHQSAAKGLKVALEEVDGCIFDAGQLKMCHGYQSLDAIGREAFVNHLHFDGEDRIGTSELLIQTWAAEMLDRWPANEFRIYRLIEEEEITIRFHMVRPNLRNWCVKDIEVIIVNGKEPL